MYVRLPLFCSWPCVWAGLLFFPFTAIKAQQERIGCSPKYELHYNFEAYSDSLQQIDFQDAMELTHHDSLRRKVNRLRYVIAYDSLSVVGRQAVYELAELQRRESDAFFGAFCGKWRWIWTGSNWGTGDSPELCRCSREIEITPDSITYLENGRVAKKVSYQMARRREHLGSPVFLVELPGEPCWRVSIDDQIDTWFATLHRNPKSTKFLNTSWGWGCVCGCQEDVYEKIE